MTGLRYSPLHVTEFCGEMQGKFKVGLARLISILAKFVLFEYNHMVIVKANTENQIFMIWNERDSIELQY